MDYHNYKLIYTGKNVFIVYSREAKVDICENVLWSCHAPCQLTTCPRLPLIIVTFCHFGNHSCKRVWDRIEEESRKWKSQLYPARMVKPIYIRRISTKRQCLAKVLLQHGETYTIYSVFGGKFCFVSMSSLRYKSTKMCFYFVSVRVFVSGGPLRWNWETSEAGDWVMSPGHRT